MWMSHDPVTFFSHYDLSTEAEWSFLMSWLIKVRKKKLSWHSLKTAGKISISFSDAFCVSPYVCRWRVTQYFCCERAREKGRHRENENRTTQYENKINKCLYENKGIYVSQKWEQNGIKRRTEWYKYGF